MRWFLRLTVIAVWMVLGVPAAPGQIIISEFLASNSEGLQDEDGEYSDWIELYNPTTGTVTLAGWFLTDDKNNLTQWMFPDVTMAPGQFLVVFASNKDRRDPAAEMHTNFALSATGEYLGLIRPDGYTIAHDYGDQYPPQMTDISYGMAQYAEDLLEEGDAVRYFVPSSDESGVDWTAPAFADASWTAGKTGLGYGAIFPGFLVKNYKANIAVSHLDVAQQVIDNPTYQTSVVEEIAPVIHYFGSDSSSNFPNPSVFPGHAPGANVDDFVLEVTGQIFIPAAGRYTFGVRSDDGFGVDITRGLFAHRFSFPGPRGAADTLSDAFYPESGLYDVRLVFYERAGGSSLEFFAASNRYTSFNAEAFRLVGDTANGGLQVVGQSGDSSLRDAMSGVNSSLWTRMTFALEEGAWFDSLTLRMQYADGFVAFLNGQEVARANAPDTLSWDATATANRPMSEVWEFQDFNLVPYLDALAPGVNVLAIQGLNATVNEEEFYLLPVLSAARNQMEAQYFTKPTPGAFNVTGAVDVVQDTQFSHKRGFYREPFAVAITTATDDAFIRYTLDGSTPTFSHGTLYTGPAPISKTSVLRAAAFKTGWLATNVDTQTYLFLADVITQTSTPPPGWPTSSINGQVFHYGMHRNITESATYGPQMEDALTQIPTWSIVTDLKNLFDPATGIYVNAQGKGHAWERPSSFEVIYPDGTEGFQIDGGLRIRGGYSRSGGNPKHAFRLFFRRMYGEGKLNYPLFGDEGVSEFDRIDLRTSQNYSWSFEGDNRNLMIRDVFARDSQRDMGNAYTRSRKYHLFINGLYWGIFETQERAEARFASSYLEGETEDFDVVKVDAGPYTINATDGTLDEWQSLWSMANSGFSSDATYYRALGCNPDGARNPDLPVLVDLDNLIDYMLLTFYIGSFDGPVSNFLGNNSPNNFYSIRNRVLGTEGWRHFAHDSEHSLLPGDSRGHDRTGPYPAGQYVQHFNPQWLHQRLAEHPEYRVRFGDRVRKHFFDDGALTPAQSIARFRARADEIDLAIIAESARWGASKRFTPRTRNDDWVPMLNLTINSYFPTRTATVLQQVRNKGWYPQTNFPTFSIAGTARRQGLFAPGEQLIITSAAGDPIYYTVDGTDPRGVSGSSAREVTLIAENASKRVFVPSVANGGSALGTAWVEPDFSDSAWRQGTGGVGYDTKATGFHPYFNIDMQDEMYNINETCYIRIPFNVTAADLEGMNSLILQMRYDDAFVIYLNGVRVAQPANVPSILTWNSGATSVHDNDQAILWKHFDLSMFTSSLQVGQNVLAIHGLNYQVTSSDFLISTQLTAVMGSEVNVSDNAIPYTGPIMLTDGMTVFARAFGGTDWSAATDGTFIQERNVNDIIVSEVMADVIGGDTGKEWFEVFNTTDDPINLNHWTICDNGTDTHEIFHPDGVIVPARGYLVLGNSTDPLVNAGAPVDYAYGSAITLGNTSDELVLRQADKVIYSIGWGAYDTTPWIIQHNLGRSPSEGKAFGMAGNYYDGPVSLWINQVSPYGTEGNTGTPGGRNDGVHVGPEPDTFPPAIINARFTRADRIQVWFDDMLDPLSAETVTNYHFDGGIGTPVSASTTSEMQVLLQFATPLTPDTPYTLSVSGVQDIHGNAIVIPQQTIVSYELPPLRVSEMMFAPPAGSTMEFIELFNASSETPVVLNGETFTDGISYTFAEGVTIAPNGYLVVTAADPMNDFQLFRDYYGIGPDVQVVGPYSGQLSNSGELIRLRTAPDGVVIFQFEYAVTRGWPIPAMGLGHSMVPIDIEDQPINALEYPGAWRASTFMLGSPGAPDPEPPLGVVLNEIMAHTDWTVPPHTSNDWIELYNRAPYAITLRDYYLSDKGDNLTRWAIPEITIPGHGRVTFDEVTDFNNPLGSGFALNKAGEDAFLSHLPGNGEDRIVDNVQFQGEENFVSLSRYPDGGPYWFHTEMTRDGANSPKIPDLVINELMYNPPARPGFPADNTFDEFVEIYNPTDSDIVMTNHAGAWRIDDGIRYTFPALTTVPARGYLLVVNFDPLIAADLANFKAHYGLESSDVQIIGPYSGNLSNRGERVALERPQAPDGDQDLPSWVIVDEVIYFDRAPFSSTADGYGHSLQRIQHDGAGLDPTNWIGGDPTPAAASGMPSPVAASGWYLY